MDLNAEKTFMHSYSVDYHDTFTSPSRRSSINEGNPTFDTSVNPCNNNGAIFSATASGTRSRSTDPSPEQQNNSKKVNENLSQATMQAQDMRPGRKRTIRRTSDIHSSVHYRGITLNMAATQGSMPVFVLIWGMAKARKINLMVPDLTGNTPLHYAALAETTEVLTFIFSQTRGWLSTDLRLVDCSNEIGETPLLRAATIGNIPVVKHLLDEGSDPFAEDYFGNTVFIVLAKQAHLWCFHYVYVFIRDRYCEASVTQHLHKCDREGHNCLDWAADSGSVNLIEYLIRRGMNVFQLDNLNRGPLYWAIKSNRVDAAKFLIKCGCDSSVPDNNGDSPHTLAQQKEHDMAATVKNETRRRLSITSANGDGSASRRGSTNQPNQPIILPTQSSDWIDIEAASDHVSPGAKKRRSTSRSRVPSLSSHFAPVLTTASGPMSAPFSPSSSYSIAVAGTSASRNSSPSPSTLPQTIAGYSVPSQIVGSPPSPVHNRTAVEQQLNETNFNGNNTGSSAITHISTFHSNLPFSPSSAKGSLTISNPSSPTQQASMQQVKIGSMSFIQLPIEADPDGLNVVSYTKVESCSNFSKFFSWCFNSDRANLSTQRFSHAISRINQTRLTVTCSFSLLYLVIMALTMCIPFYAWIALVVISILIYRHTSDKVTTAKLSKSSSNINGVNSGVNGGVGPFDSAPPPATPSTPQQGQYAQDTFPTLQDSTISAAFSPCKAYKSILTFCSDYIQSPERYIGLHLAFFGCYIFYWVSCFLYGLQPMIGSPYMQSVNLNGNPYSYYDPFHIGALSGGEIDKELLYTIGAMLVVTICLWLQLAWFQHDPGSVDTRYQDFDAIMDRSLLCQGPPPSRFSCRTTMVMKPIRSKYDASTGLLIARMDHYCIWLNCTIGFKNHRLFMSFLISQLFTCSLFCAFIILALQRELQGRCGIAENLLGAHYLFPSVLLSASIVLAISLAILTYDQINNILRNQTVNEKVNYTRYPWMVDETGSFNNRFDRGWILNLLEFLQIPGYSVDYMCIFDIPGPANDGTRATARNTAALSTASASGAFPNSATTAASHDKDDNHNLPSSLTQQTLTHTEINLSPGPNSINSSSSILSPAGFTLGPPKISNLFNHMNHSVSTTPSSSSVDHNSQILQITSSNNSFRAGPQAADTSGTSSPNNDQQSQHSFYLSSSNSSNSSPIAKGAVSTVVANSSRHIPLQSIQHQHSNTSSPQSPVVSATSPQHLHTLVLNSYNYTSVPSTPISPISANSICIDKKKTVKTITW